MRLGWTSSGTAPITGCDEHIYDSACALCRASDQNAALEAVVRAVLELGQELMPPDDPAVLLSRWERPQLQAALTAGIVAGTITARSKLDLRVALAWSGALESTFVQAYRRIYCPACRKRLSPMFDAVNAGSAVDHVQMLCRHCSHRFWVPRDPQRSDSARAHSDG